MYKTKQLISLILVLAMCLSLGTTAFAVEISTSGSSAETPVILNVEAALFSVTIPTGLPVDVAANGTVTVATDAKIINNSHGPVQVVNMTIEAVDGWEIADYEIDLRNEKVDSNKISMIINELKTTGSDAIEFSADNFTVMLAKNDDTTDECSIVYNAKVTPLSEAFATDTVANLVFTVDWYKAEGSASETTTSIHVVATDSDGNNLNATSTDIVGTEKDDLLTKLEESGLVASADEVDALIEVESDDFDNFANATFDVSEIAQEGDKVVVLHFDETTQQWEYVTEETVDAEGKISADFTSFSPVAFVVVKEDGSTAIVTPIPEGGTYTIAATSEVLEAGDAFPETVAAGDIYTYGDYEYRYNQYCYGSGWSTDSTQNGWGVSVLDDTKTAYGEILESINGKSVTSLYMTFHKCTSFTTAPEIPSSVTNMAYTFNCCSSLVFSPAIPSSVTYMNGTFQSCTSLTTAPVIPSSVTNMDYIFSGCTNLKTYAGSTDTDGDFSNYVIPDGVTSMKCVFSDCKQLTVAPTIHDGVTDISSIFANCANLKTYAGSTDADYDFSNYVIPEDVTNMTSTFYGTNITVAPEVPSSVTNMSRTFCNCASLTTAPVLPDGVRYIDYIFSGCTNLKTYTGSTDSDGDFSNYVIPSNVIDVKSTFYGCTLLTAAPVIPYGITDMSYTFYECTSLTIAPEIPSSVKNMSQTFYNCTSLTTAPMGNAYLVTNMDGTFSNCTSLTGTIIIAAAPTSYTDCFSGVDFAAQNLTLAASAYMDEIGATGTNYCAECNGACQNNH